MVTRAVSAGRDWLTPLALLVPILATVAATLWALTFWPPLMLVTIAGGLTVTAFAGARTYGVRTALAVGALTLIAGAVGLFVSFWAALSSSSICGKSVADTWQWLPFAGGVLVYFALGSYGFRSNRAYAVVPLALFAGVIAILVLIALLPGTQGYCD
jgi:hypothetical protein